MERRKSPSGARAAGALFVLVCGACLTIQVMMSTIVRHSDVMRLGKGLVAIGKAASAIVMNWR